MWIWLLQEMTLLQEVTLLLGKKSRLGSGWRYGVDATARLWKHG